MSAKGLSLTMFYSTMESSTTTYVLCGLAVIMFWNFFSKYMVRSAVSKGRRPPKQQRDRGGTAVVVVSSSSPEAPGGVPGDGEGADRLRNGTAGRKAEPPEGDDRDCVESRPSPVRPGGPTRAGPPGRGPEEVDGGGGGGQSAVQGETRGGCCEGQGPHVVHLLEDGWTEEDLDVLQCPIEVYAWFAHRQSCGCSFELAVILQDKRRSKIAEYLYSPESCKPTANKYKKVSLIFENYGVGVRYVTYSHRRRKPTEESCKGECGSEVYSGLRKTLEINNL